MLMASIVDSVSAKKARSDTEITSSLRSNSSAPGAQKLIYIYHIETEKSILRRFITPPLVTVHTHIKTIPVF